MSDNIPDRGRSRKAKEPSLRLSALLIAVLLLTLAGQLLDHATDVALWADKAFHLTEDVTQTSMQDGSDRYDASASPLDFGAVENPHNAYIHITLRFRADDTDGNGILLQTAPANDGLRIEVVGQTLHLLMRDLSRKKHLGDTVLTDKLEKGRWYALEVEALNSGFVRVFIDGTRVLYNVWRKLQPDMSHIVVGGGLEAAHNFHGPIDRIHIRKGNIVIPHDGFTIVYAVFALLLLLLMGITTVIPRNNEPVSIFFAKAAVLSLPVLGFLLYAEWRLSDLDTAYYMKRVYLEQRIEKLQVLITGSSNALYGIDPDQLSVPAYNLAFLGNEMPTDGALLRRYVPRMKDLKTVVLTLNYFTMSMDYRSGGFTQPWRQYFVRQFLGVPSSALNHWYSPVFYWVKPGNFSKIVLYGDQVYADVGSLHTAPIDIVPSEDGWYDSGDLYTADADAERMGKDAAASHSANFNAATLDRNIAVVASMITYLQARHIRVLVIMLPVDRSYYGNMTPTVMVDTVQAVRQMADDHDVSFIDYTKDARFKPHDFVIGMTDHMNSHGALKMSKILDGVLLKVPLSNDRR